MDLLRSRSLPEEVMLVEIVRLNQYFVFRVKYGRKASSNDNIGHVASSTSELGSRDADQVTLSHDDPSYFLVFRSIQRLRTFEDNASQKVCLHFVAPFTSARTFAFRCPPSSPASAMDFVVV